MAALWRLCYREYMPYANADISREKGRGYSQQYRKRKGNAPPGICSVYPHCKNPTQDGFKKCPSCRQYMQDYKKGIKRPVSTQRDCLKCGAPTGSTRTHCVACTVPKGKDHPNYAKYAARGQEHDAECWAATLEHYGARCACCGETERMFLTVDHIDGEKHGSGNQRGAALCAWLIRNDFPPGFRILCVSCNGSLGFRGYCPHGDLKQVRHSGRPTTRVRSEEEKQALRDRWHEMKLAALNAYGGARCVCCSEDRIEFLTLDHPEDDGAEQRRVLTGKNYGSSSKFYSWLKKENYPQWMALRVLCSNCNAGRYRNGGVCPHETVRMKGC